MALGERLQRHVAVAHRLRQLIEVLHPPTIPVAARPVNGAV